MYMNIFLIYISLGVLQLSGPSRVYSFDIPRNCFLCIGKHIVLLKTNMGRYVNLKKCRDVVFLIEKKRKNRERKKKFKK